MQHIKFLLTLTFISAVLFNCTVKEGQNDKAEKSQELNKEQIDLNKGKKWLVNDEMKPFLMKSEQILHSYTRSSDTSHVALASQLEAQNNQLIASCTMDGKSHDELHKWLHPHLQLVKALKNAKSEKEAEVIIKQLEESYKIYHQYFQ